MNSDSVLGGNLRVDDQRERHRGHQRDRRKILHRIVGQLLVERLVDGQRGRGRHQQRVAVGFGPRHQFGAGRGRGPRLVLDHDGGAKAGLELVGDQAAEKIGGAAGRIGHDHLDGPAGIGRLRRAGTPFSKTSPPPSPAIAFRRVNSMGPPRTDFSGHNLSVRRSRFANHISRCCDISKATKVQSRFAAVQQPTMRLNQTATLMGYFRKIAIADQLRSRLPGRNGRALISLPARLRGASLGLQTCVE